jgi:thiol-disulfide isomerase/thioredoxin
VVVVSFWASWCGPCKEELPALESIYQKHARDGLVVVGVNIDSRRKKMESFLKDVPVTFRIVHDPKAEVAARYEPPTMPTSYLVGRRGKLRHVQEGFERGDAEQLEARIRSLLAVKPEAR